MHIKFTVFLLTLLFSFSLQDQLFRHLQSCSPGCLTCSSVEVCNICDVNRVLKDGKCLCESPRILIGNDCVCPSYITQNPTTLKCEYTDLLDIAYHSTFSPLFDTVFHAQMNPVMKYTLAPFVFWSADCNFKNADTESKFFEYVYGQITDRLHIPSSALEFDLQCDLTATYTNNNGVDIIKQIQFTTLSASQPQVHIIGGPFQTLKHTEMNLLLIEVYSSSGSPISPSDAKVTWTQTSGEDQLDMTQLYSPSNPYRLTLPKCTLSQGKLYTFKVSVKIGNSVVTSQEVTIAVHSPKITLEPLKTDTYHLYNNNLKLTGSQFSIQDECEQGILPSDFLDLSTTMYTWECAVVDLYDTDRRRLLSSESIDIKNDANVVSHPDPQHLFYTSTTSKTLTIPKSYFSNLKDYQLIFYLTATIKSKTPTPSIKSFNLYQPTLYTLQTKAYVRILDSQPFMTPSLSCTSENDCEGFSVGFFPAKFIASDYNPQYSYSWKLNTFDSDQESIQIQNFFTVGNIIIPFSSNSHIVPQILLTVSDGTNTASAFYTIPINTSPTDGFVLIYPQDGGEAYKTNFFVTTTNWIDQDLPVSFQWYTWTFSGGENFMIPTFEPFTYTPMVQPPKPFPATVGVWITDNLKSKMVTEWYLAIPSSPKNWSELIEQSNLALSSSKSSTDLFQRFRQISVIIENIQAWEDYEKNPDFYNASAEIKSSAMTEMIQVFLALDQKEELKPIILKNLLYCTQQLFNQDRNFQLYLEILNSYFQADSSKTIYAQTDREIFAKILNNLLNYLLKPGVLIQDPDEIWAIYVNTLVRSMLYNKIPSEDAITYSQTFLLAQTLKTTYCQILKEEITNIPWGNGLTANFTLKSGKTIKPEQCNRQIDFIFLGFRHNYTVPPAWGVEYRTIIYMDIRDSITGESLMDLFNWFLLSPSELCPEITLCGPDGNGGTVIYGTFDFKNQIMKIFGKSNIELVKNFSALQDFQFWQSVAFWTVIAFTIWFLISFYLLYRYPAYCVLEKNKNINKKSLFKKIAMFFLLVHPLTSIYVYHDQKIPKTNKLTIYYQRLIVLLAFSTIFSTIKKGEGTVFKAYILLFNMFTLTPLNGIFSRIFLGISDLKISKQRTYLRRIKFFLIVFLYLLILAGCFVIIFVIAAQQDGSENISWAIYFAISFAQDLTLSPLISIINKVFLLTLPKKYNCLQGKTSQQFFTVLIPVAFKYIHKTIFVAPIQTPSRETITSLPTSPLSTSRKLLKFGSFETPTLPKSSSKPFDFRSRRASEIEINAEELAAIEAVATERFQSLVSEAKSENIKIPSSPTKENYHKMQTANRDSIYSLPKLSTAFSSKGQTQEKLMNLMESMSQSSPKLPSIFNYRTQERIINMESMNRSSPRLPSIFNYKTQEKIINLNSILSTHFYPPLKDGDESPEKMITSFDEDIPKDGNAVSIQLGQPESSEK